MNTPFKLRPVLAANLIILALSGCGDEPRQKSMPPAESTAPTPWGRTSHQDPEATEAAVADFEAEPEPGRRIRSVGSKANALAKSNPGAVVGIYSRAINHDLALEAEEAADLTPAGNLEIRISADSWNHIKHSLAQLARIAPEVAAAVIDKTDDEFRAALAESTTAELLPDPYSLALYMRAMQDSDLAKGIGWQVAESLLDSHGENEARRLLPAYEEILHVPSQDMIDRILARRFSETRQAANP